MAILTVAVHSRVANAGHFQAPQPADELGASYRVDALEPVLGETPDAVQILRESAAPAWSATAYERVERRIRAEWDASRIYGPVYSSVGLWLRYPLATARVGGRVLVPVLESQSLSIEGLVGSAPGRRSRRVVILIDASESSNAPIPDGADGDHGGQMALLGAERRALEGVVSRLEMERHLEVGIIAFGEGTWPIVEIGASAEAARQGLARLGREHPSGEGRSDAVCALWTAYDWLRDTPEGVDREIVLVTGADLPHSGRFVGCSGAASSESAQQACQEARNISSCPATHEFTRLDGFSDIAQLASFGRRVRGELMVTPVLFENSRNRRLYTEIARRTGGRVVRVPSARGIEELLPALVTRSITGVFARNSHTGAESSDLLSGDRQTIDGEISLAPGANDIELRIDSGGSTAGLFRFRVYSAPEGLPSPLAELAAPPPSLGD